MFLIILKDSLNRQNGLETYEVVSKLQLVALNKYTKGMQLLYIALITKQ
jgi:hypothetical protein